MDQDTRTQADREGPENRRRRAAQDAFTGLLLRADTNRLRGIVRRMVCSDMPGAGPDAYCKPGEHAIKINKHGAASCHTKAGLLGLKPAEFDWVTPLGKVGDTIDVGDVVESALAPLSCSCRIVAVKLVDMGGDMGWCFAVAVEVPQ